MGLLATSVRFQIQHDLKLTVRELDISTEAKTEEQKSQEQYEKFMAESSASWADKVKEVTGLDDSKATLQSSITATKSKFEKQIGRFSCVVECSLWRCIIKEWTRLAQVTFPCALGQQVVPVIEADQSFSNGTRLCSNCTIQV